jgi:hypothetical protein
MIDLQKSKNFFQAVDGQFERPATIYLVGETSQLFEGWQRWITHLDFFCNAAESEQSNLNTILTDVAESMGINIVVEFPGDVVPLPEGYDSRSRALTETDWAATLKLDFLHFDPYSVSFRFIARGGQTDYDLVLRYLENGWINQPELEARLEKLLPEMTFETIQQDPAEFRRRYAGLMQLWRARESRLNQSHLGQSNLGQSNLDQSHRDKSGISRSSLT